MNGPRLVIFDLDGTTVKDGGQVARAFTHALATHDIEITPERLSSVRGLSKREAVLNFIPEGPERAARAEIIYASFRQHLAQQFKADGAEPIEGAEHIFRWLREQRVRVALNTGFDREITRLLLSMLNWEDAVVDAVVCGDDVRQGRPAPYLIFRAMEATNTIGVQQVANLGDTVQDLKAGHNAGVRWNIGVLSGAHDRPMLEQAPHTHLLQSIVELHDLFGETKIFLT